MSGATQLREAATKIADETPGVPMEGLAALRVPFPPTQVGKLPKPYSKDAPRGTCPECGKYHGLPAMHLDFVGHGFVTQRLLEVDPEWSWEPFAIGPDGLPALDKWGNLWIRLTVCGVTRIGVGDGASMKVLIGDAIRNAAMRFGVALDLWAKGSEDEKDHDGESMPQPRQAQPPQTTSKHPLRVEVEALDDGARLWAHFLAQAGIDEKDADALLAADEDWRKWLTGAIAAHKPKADGPAPDEVTS